jgi:hypothetical protein
MVGSSPLETQGVEAEATLAQLPKIEFPSKGVVSMFLTSTKIQSIAFVSKPRVLPLKSHCPKL